MDRLCLHLNFILTVCDFAQRAVLYLMDVYPFSYSNWVLVLVAAVVFSFLHLCNMCIYTCYDMHVRSEGNLLESVLPLLPPGFQSWNSGQQTSQRVLLLTEASHWSVPLSVKKQMVSFSGLAEDPGLVLAPTW